jgi:hypothetical protein
MARRPRSDHKHQIRTNRKDQPHTRPNQQIDVLSDEEFDFIKTGQPVKNRMIGVNMPRADQKDHDAAIQNDPEKKDEQDTQSHNVIPITHCHKFTLPRSANKGEFQSMRFPSAVKRFLDTFAYLPRNLRHPASDFVNLKPNAPLRTQGQDHDGIRVFSWDRFKPKTRQKGR